LSIPDLEVGRFLTERAHFEHSPGTEGWIEYRVPNKAPRTLALLQSFAVNEGDTWEYTLGELRRYLEIAATRQESPHAGKNPIEMLEISEPDALAAELMAPYLESARLLGRRVAELHIALSSSTVDPDFAAEPFTTLYRRSTYQSMRNQLSQVTRLANGVGASISKEDREELRSITTRHADLIKPFERFLNTRISVSRIRTHGDLHLGQVLHTGKDFMIIDSASVVTSAPRYATWPACCARITTLHSQRSLKNLGARLSAASILRGWNRGRRSGGNGHRGPS